MGQSELEHQDREKCEKQHSVQDVVDAVTGATWNTRNRIMEDLFHDELQAGLSTLPSFKPPGTPLV